MRRLVWSAHFLILAAAFTASIALGATAQAAPATYWVKLDDVPKDSLCLGQQVQVWGSFGVVPGQLPSVFGPDMIVAHAVLGTPSPQQIAPGTPSGSFSFFYTASKAGIDQITVVVQDAGNNVASASVRVKVVEKCEYYYSLKGVLVSSSGSGDVTMDQTLILKVRGRLKAENPEQPLKLTSKGNMQFTQEITNFSFPECTMPNLVPGVGFGDVQVTAEPDLDGYAMVVKFTDPKLDGTVAAEIICPDHTARRQTGFNQSMLGNSGGVWIEKTMTTEGGTFPVEIDMLQTATNRLRIAGTASYSATLTIERANR